MNHWLARRQERLKELRTLSSSDIASAREYERLTGEVAYEWKELVREQLDMSKEMMKLLEDINASIEAELEERLSKESFLYFMDMQAKAENI